MHLSRIRRRGLLAIIGPFVAGQRAFELQQVRDHFVDLAFQAGLGPILAHITRDARGAAGSYGTELEAADLTARVLAAETLDAVDELAAALNAADCEPVLLKGMTSALRYYPEPHLRTMADVDILVEAARAPAIESFLRTAGFEPRSRAPETAFVGHHHSMPLFDPRRHVFVEIHTALFPPRYPAALDPRFAFDRLGRYLAPVKVGRHSAWAMNDELHLVYTSTRWTEMLNTSTGVFPILDVALLLRARGEALDWNSVIDLVRGSWGAGALRLMLEYLAWWDLARVPAWVLRSLAAEDRHMNRALIGALHRMVTAYVIEGRHPGPLMTRRNIRLLWSSLVAPRSPSVKLAILPVTMILARRSAV